MVDLHVGGNHIGAAYVIIGLIRLLYVRVSVSFCCPQDDPDSALRMFSRPVHLVLMALMWGVKESDGSRVTPRILGVLSRGRVALP